MKKTTLVYCLFLLAVSLFTFLPKAAAVGTSEWGLPEGAKARLGKGYNHEIAYFPDNSKLAVASSIGVYLRGKWEVGPQAGIRASTCRYLSRQEPCSALRWQKRTR